MAATYHSRTKQELEVFYTYYAHASMSFGLLDTLQADTNHPQLCC